MNEPKVKPSALPEYKPSILIEELPQGVLEKLPKHWTKNYDDDSVKHLLSWRHAIETDYNDKLKNLNITREHLRNAKDSGSSSLVAPLSQKLIEDSADMLAAHDRLRDLENKINQQINEIEREKRLEKERSSSKFLSWIAVGMSLVGIFLNYFKKDHSPEEISILLNDKIALFYSSKFKPEFLKILDVEVKTPYRSAFQQLAGELEKLKTDLQKVNQEKAEQEVKKKTRRK